MFLGDRPYEVIEELETPVGAVRIQVNGNYVPFRYGMDSYDNSVELPVSIHIIDLDVSELHTDDEIFCGLEADLLEYNDGDENSILYTYENDELMFGIGAFDPFDIGADRCCFELKKCTPKGYFYRIAYEPADLKRPHIFFKHIALSVAWIKKELCEDPDTMLCLALT